MVSLTSISNDIYFQFRARQFDSLKKKRLGLFHVTDYTKACMRNTYYAHIKTDAKKSMGTDMMSMFFVGEAVHQLLDSAAPKGLGERLLAYNFVDDKPVELLNKDGSPKDEIKKWDVLEWMKILIGESDSLYDITVDGTKQKVIVDYKTWLSKGFPKKSPSDDHVYQVSEYKYLFNKTLDLDVKYGAIIYLDLSNRMAKPLIFPKELDSLTKIRAGLIAKYELLRECYETGVLPPRVKTWLCEGYCEHAERCVAEEQLSVEDRRLEIVT